jgi:hypothetical protein
MSRFTEDRGAIVSEWKELKTSLWQVLNEDKGPDEFTE